MNKLVKYLIKAASFNPKKIAIDTGEKKITYENFLKLVYKLSANFEPILRNTKNKSVVLINEKSIHAYACQFATLLSGGYYIPLDKSLPVSQIEKIIKSINPALIYTNIELQILTNEKIITDCSIKNKEFKGYNSAHKLAYIKFTSGTSGNPKGVMISQLAMNNYVDWVIKAFQANNKDNWSQHPSLSFDICITDIFGCLTTGGTLFPFIAESDKILPAEKIKKNKITIWNSVPSIIDTLSRLRKIESENLGTIRLFNFCGEQLYRSQVTELSEAVPKSIIQNTYGPTEATVACKAIALDKKMIETYDSNVIELGYDLPNIQTFIEKNQLLISGIQVAEGYWSNKTLTRKYFKDKIVNGFKKKVYYTGDYVNSNKKNQIFFKSREDKQIKIRGHRVELEEISIALKKIGFSESTVIFSKKKLVAFICSDDFDELKIIAKLSKLLPKVAIPTVFKKLKQLPRTKNFKINVNKLIKICQEIER